MPPAQYRTEMHEKARKKKYSLLRTYDLQCAPFHNPATNKEETRILVDGRVVLKKGDKGTLIKWHRWNAFYTPPIKKHLAFLYANFEMTRMSTGKANVVYSQPKSYFSIVKIWSWSFFFWPVYLLAVYSDWGSQKIKRNCARLLPFTVDIKRKVKRKATSKSRKGIFLHN